jgi:transcriptional regulator with XRE-family HTH domain
MDLDSKPTRIVSLLGRNLKAARRHAGLSQRELAERTGITLGRLVQIEGGISDPDLRIIDSLAKAVGRAAFELLES